MKLLTCTGMYSFSATLTFNIMFFFFRACIYISVSLLLDRLCVVFLTFSCVGYAMPFILCVTICCCLPCIISTLGVTEDLTQTRGATTESINALPTHKFKLNRNKSRDESTPDVFEGGVVAGGTEKERMISGEDAVSTN